MFKVLALAALLAVPALSDAFADEVPPSEITADSILIQVIGDSSDVVTAFLLGPAYRSDPGKTFPFLTHKDSVDGQIIFQNVANGEYIVMMISSECDMYQSEAFTVDAQGPLTPVDLTFNLSTCSFEYLLSE